ncbi:hypothetical protein D9M73_217570 [compost metagenome]
MRRLLAVEVKGAPASPAPVGGGILAPFIGAREPGQAQRGHALDHGHAVAAHRDLLQVPVPHIVEHQHHAAGGQSAQVVVAFEQDGVGTVARCRQRGRQTCRATAHHHDICPGRDAHVPGRLLDPVTDLVHCYPRNCCCGAVFNGRSRVAT